MIRVVVPIIQAQFAAGLEPFSEEQRDRANFETWWRLFMASRRYPCVKIVTPFTGTAMREQWPGSAYTASFPPTWRAGDLEGY